MTESSKGLGRGLQSLLGRPSPSSERRSAGEIPINAIRPGQSQPRAHMRKESLEELAASIKSNGVIQPIVVRPLANSPGQYEIVAGERRWQAAKLANLTQVPAVVRDLTDQEAIVVALIENIQREELTPAEEARALQRLIDEFGLTHQEVAESVGKSRATVSNLIRLLDLPSEVVALIDSKALSMGHARTLLGLEDDAQRQRLAHLIVERNISVRETERLVRRAREGQGRETARPPELSVVSEILRTPLGRLQLLQRRSGVGRLIVDFSDSTTRNAMVDAITMLLSGQDPSFRRRDPK